MINSEFQLEIVTDLAVEPVTLQEAKDYMRISSDSENDLIEELITSARERIEKFTGLSLGEKTLRAYWFYFHVPQEIPYGPVTLIDSVVNDEDVALEYTARGLQYKMLEAYSTVGLTIEYEAGFAVCPKTFLSSNKASATNFASPKLNTPFCVAISRPCPNMPYIFSLFIIQS